MTDLLNDLIAFFEARNTGNATNDLLNRCKEAQSEQLLIPVFVGSYADKKENKLGMCHTCGDFKCVDSFCKG